MPPGPPSQGGSTSNIEIGYPEGSTLFYPILVYNHGFRYFNMGYASAMAMLLLAVAFAVTAVIIWNSRRVVHYQGMAPMTAVAHAEPAPSPARCRARFAGGGCSSRSPTTAS